MRAQHIKPQALSAQAAGRLSAKTYTQKKEHLGISEQSALVLSVFSSPITTNPV